MLRFYPILALFFALAQPALSAEPLTRTAATVVTLEGQAQWQEGAAWNGLALGQLLGAGDRVRTGEGSSLHLILADGSSLALGPNTELTLQGLAAQGGSTIIQLFKGALHAIVEKLTLGASFEVRTTNAVAAVKGTEFVVDAAEDDTAVTVAEGEVQMGDSERKSFRPLRPLERGRLARQRWSSVERLSKREAGPWMEGLQRDRVFHGQREALLKGLRSDAKARRRFERQLEQRQERRERKERLRQPSGERREKRLERLHEARDKKAQGEGRREERKAWRKERKDKNGEKEGAKGAD